MANVATTRPTVFPGRKAARRHGLLSNRSLWIGLIPALVLIAIFVGAGVVQAVTISFTDWRGIGKAPFVGFRNYIEAFTESDTLSTLGVTLLYAVSTSFGIVLVATLLAAAISGRVRGSRWYRVIWFLPGIAPGAAVAIFWTQAFQPHFGAINVIRQALGFGDSSALLADPSTALIPVILVSIWASTGFAFLLMLGAMEQIPDNIYEAAKVDGASPVRQFFSITLPLARPVIVITAMLEIIWAFNGFSIVWAMTRGGPGDATSTLPVIVYKEAFQSSLYGPASALAVIGSIVLIAIGIVGTRLSRSAQ